MKSRTKARSLALQVLYESDLTGHPAGSVLMRQVEEEQTDAKSAEFAREIVAGNVPIKQQLDDIIAEHAPEWPMDQVATIDRNILRIALWEFAVAQITPIKVAINEAVELSKVYGSDSTPRFVNGVLGSLANRHVEVKSSLARLIQ